ncbi:uncharacterized protein P7C73_g3808, partial [Tremellales sp. Uapishka_1]
MSESSAITTIPKPGTPIPAPDASSIPAFPSELTATTEQAVIETPPIPEDVHVASAIPEEDVAQGPVAVEEVVDTTPMTENIVVEPSISGDVGPEAVEVLVVETTRESTVLDGTATETETAIEPVADTTSSLLEDVPPNVGENEEIKEITMEIAAVEGTTGDISEEAAQLLLNFSSVVERPITPPKGLMEKILEGESTVDDHMEQETGQRPYPFTPPDDKSSPTQPSISVANLLSLQIESSTSTSIVSLPPAPLASISTTSPEPPTKPKPKRKRNAVAGPSRRASVERPSHWMGEDNTDIRCICGVDEDDGFTIQCDGCGAWEHGSCFGYLDAASAPDTYLCEICEPRPFDATIARTQQLARIHFEAFEATRRAALVRGLGEEGDVKEKEKEKEKEKGKPRGKAKRARTDSIMDDTQDRESVKEHSPLSMAPPPSKPKRRVPGPKPRNKQMIPDGPPAPATFKEPLPPVEADDDYFKVEPWALEFTPIENNVVRGVKTRQMMCSVYREWVDGDDEVVMRKKRPIHDGSGLPSPTEPGILRLSPEILFAPPDFGILAPPIPPVFLSGPDLAALASPTSIKPIADSSCFLPLNYTELAASTGIYTRPAVYGVFADEPIPTGSFLGDYRGEIVESQAYRRDPINQYSGLGIPKPYVRSIGPPIDLVIDARGYGCNLRFIRSGCHPNVVLRPSFYRKAETETPQLKFGIFASKDIGKKEEIVLGWEWDDQHVVHFLKTMVETPAHVELPPRTLAVIRSKFESVITHLLGTFSSCACESPVDCAIAQMCRLVEGSGGDGLGGKGRVRRKAELGELVGAIRGWRRRENEEKEMDKWRMPEFGLDLKRFHLGLEAVGAPMEDEAMELDDKEDETDMDVDVDVDMDMDVQVDETEVEATPVTQARPLPPLPPASDTITAPPQPISSSPHTSIRPSAAVPTQRKLSASPSPSLQPKAKLRRVDSSSSLSSVASNSSLSDDDGELSDATTATLPKSQFSEDEASEAEEERTPKRTVKSSPTKRTPRKGPRRKGVVFSSDDDEGDEEEELRPVVPRKRKSAVIPTPLKRSPSPPRKRPTPASKEPTPPPPRELSVPLKVSTPPPREPTPPPREPTPPPKEPTPPPKEPTPPPPEPPKKVSLADYLKQHKIRKDSSSLPPATPSQVTPSDEIPGFGKIKTEESPKASKINLNEHLPSESPRPGATPIVPSAAFTPRPSASYTPRASMSDLPSASSSYTPPSQFGSYTPSYQPREREETTPTSTAYVPRPVFDEPLALPPPPPLAPSISYELPPVLSSREMPPHQLNQYPAQHQNQHQHQRVIPTGPKNIPPPTGPRGSWAPGGPTRGVGMG